MKSLSSFIVDKRIIILLVALPIIAASIWLTTQVTVNRDMTRYLPSGSPTKTGMTVSDENFAPAAPLKVMFKDLTAEQKESIETYFEGLDGLVRVPGASHLTVDNNADGYTLFSVTVASGPYAAKTADLVQSIKDKYADYKPVISGAAEGPQTQGLMTFIITWAVLIAMVILFALAESWVEPPLFLAVMMAAVAINMGTNAVFSYVAETTHNIAAVLQLCLSMDYSIMLLTRYRQEKAALSERGVKDNPQAMKNALTHSFVAIIGSSGTTIVGMLVLLFMSFTMGRDVGLVLAKGVALSLICIFTLLPALILIFDKPLEKARKPHFVLKMGAIARFNYKVRYGVPVFFAVLFIAAFIFRGNVGVTYGFSAFDKVSMQFPPTNAIVAIYENDRELSARYAAEVIEKDKDVTNLNAYYNTAGRELSYAETAAVTDLDDMTAALIYFMYSDENAAVDALPVMGMTTMLQGFAASDNPMFASFVTPEKMREIQYAISQSIPQEALMNPDAQIEMDRAQYGQLLGVDPSLVARLFDIYLYQSGIKPSATMTIGSFVDFVLQNVAENPMFAPLMSDEMKTALYDAKAGVDAAGEQFVGNKYSRMMIETRLPEESAETFALVSRIKDAMNDNVGGDHYYLIGSSAFDYEMNDTFPDEMFFITILTAAAIFVIIMIAFRSLSVPLVLVLLIQCAVFLTMGTVYIMDGAMMYLPLLIVQCLLMGATVDYGILYASYYREARLTMNVKDATVKALNDSIHTILTSASILIFVTTILGVALRDSSRAVADILRAIGTGGLCSFALVVFVLPGIMAAFDRFTAGKGAKR